MNTSLMHTRTVEAIRPRSNDERRAQWASRYFAQGNHREPSKPRIRVKPRVRVVARPLSTEPARAGKGFS